MGVAARQESERVVGKYHAVDQWSPDRARVPLEQLDVRSLPGVREAQADGRDAICGAQMHRPLLDPVPLESQALGELHHRRVEVDHCDSHVERAPDRRSVAGVAVIGDGFRGGLWPTTATIVSSDTILVAAVCPPSGLH